MEEGEVPGTPQAEAEAEAEALGAAVASRAEVAAPSLQQGQEPGEVPQAEQEEPEV